MAIQASKGSQWSPDSWQSKLAVQQPSYPDADALQTAVRDLGQLPPLVTSWEVENLRAQLAEAERGERFVLQGGDCAESFADCRPEIITNRLKVLLQMSLVMTHGMHTRITRIGRFAGQYAKPRSADTETRGDQTLPAYRGDLVNGPAFDPSERVPQPQRLIEGHMRSALTLNFIRGLIDGGFADLHHPEYWDLDWVQASPLAADYQARVDSIGESLRFMERLASTDLHELNRVDFHCSHEALVLHYEQAQTRQVPRKTGWFNLSTQLPWIGMRTAALDGAHIEYCRGIRNPIGVKIGPAMDASWLVGICRALNPDNEPGKLILIHRMGAGKVGQHLPALIEAVRKADANALWMCDPMHGNTQSTAGGVKTRRFDDIVAELTEAFAIHADAGSRLGGVHLELTGEDVTECLGGARNLTEDDLSRAYRSQVDPRLNYEQAMEIALRIAAI